MGDEIILKLGAREENSCCELECRMTAAVFVNPPARVSSTGVGGTMDGLAQLSRQGACLLVPVSTPHLQCCTAGGEKCRRLTILEQRGCTLSE